MTDIKVAIVTGASSGLGRATALEFASLGWNVVCADLRPDAPVNESLSTVDAIQTNSNGHATFVLTDVSSSEAMQSLISAAVSTYDRLDVLVNNAGISLESVGQRGPKRIAETDDSTFDTTWAINTRSVFLGCKYAIQQFLRQEPWSNGDRGWIVNVASVFALKPEIEHVSYSTTKAAVAHMSKCIAREYGPDKIHCNVICPGFVETAMDRQMLSDEKRLAQTVALHPWGTLGKPEHIAKAIRFLVGQDAAWITGVSLPVDGGYLTA